MAYVIGHGFPLKPPQNFSRFAKDFAHAVSQQNLLQQHAAEHCKHGHFGNDRRIQSLSGDQ
jgi:hypothetical protein